MSIAAIDKVDLVSKKKSGEYVLIIVADEPWEDNELNGLIVPIVPTGRIDLIVPIVPIVRIVRRGIPRALGAGLRSGRTRKQERNKKAGRNPAGLPGQIAVGVNPIFLFLTPRSRSCLDQFSCAVREIVFPCCRKFRRHQGTGAIKKNRMQYLFFTKRNRN